MFYLRHVIFLTNGSVRDKLLLIFCVTETGEGRGGGGGGAFLIFVSKMTKVCQCLSQYLKSEFFDLIPSA